MSTNQSFVVGRIVKCTDEWRRFFVQAPGYVGDIMCLPQNYHGGKVQLPDKKLGTRRLIKLISVIETEKGYRATNWCFADEAKEDRALLAERVQVSNPASGGRGSRKGPNERKTFDKRFGGCAPNFLLKQL